MLFLHSFAAWSDEGLNSRPPPSEVTRAWNATFLLFGRAGTTVEIGSAIVVRREGDWVDLLTTNHTLKEFCTETDCPRLRVFNNVRIPWSQRSSVRIADETEVARVIARDPKTDLALLRWRDRTDARPPAFAALCVAPARVYAIGFSVTADRPRPTRIDAPQVLTRRWSIGELIARASVGGDGQLKFGWIAGAPTVLATSADAMTGSSGGPLLNERGEIIGLVVRVLEGPVIGAYVKLGPGRYDEVNAIGIPCETIRAFLDANHVRTN